MLQLVPSATPPPPHADHIRQEVRTFIADSLKTGAFSPSVDSWTVGWDPAFSAELGRRGLLGMTIPEQYGGRGASHLERYIVIEELLAAGAPVAAHWVADRQAAPSLLSHGTEYQRQRYLPGIAKGELYFGIGMSEPESGSDLASVQTTAKRAEGGWEITGTKIWTSGAHHCHAFFVLARTEPLDPQHRHHGLSQFIVDLDSPGIDIRPIKFLTGLHHFNEVVLDHVFVPDELVLGAIGDGWSQVTSELAYERSGPERILSSFPVLEGLVTAQRPGPDQAEPDQAGPQHAAIGALVARAFVLRQMSLAIAGSLAAGKPENLSAAIVKDLGTQFEKEVIETAAAISAHEPDPTSTAGQFGKTLADAIHQSPGFTLRGGTNEVLRGVIVRELGLR
ncbi:acyl-CoA dehydrogenase family protein [Aeromicrobium yanjiei]|uniref:Acyl-CoA dehydrogenase n=1 Tax=Aeromicrobium yanjiei TaxID=2662028 RepID=A0A5Q2MF35_9ACTN|nr:acyl-CoA dehydrogenase family protein [Aeromicrobium yanjiei]QGG40329.1 acyl-CoA dehydrogenase [Aeromicrobium yanjiei]